MELPALAPEVLIPIMVLSILVFTAGGGWVILNLGRAAREGSTWTVTLTATALLLASIACFIVTGIVAWDSWWYTSHATPIEGRTLASPRWGQGGELSHIEYEYQGRTYYIESRWGTARQRWQERAGQKVLVLVDPSPPHSARVGSFGSLWGVSLVFLAVGFLFLIGSLCMWAFRGRLRRRRGREHGTTTGSWLQTHTDQAQINEFWDATENR